MPHACALLALAEADHALSVSDLVAQSCVDQSNVSRLCTRMEAAGEIERLENPADRRSRLVRLTVHGRRVAAQVDGSSAGHFERVIGGLKGQPDAVMQALNDLAAALEGTESPGAPRCSAAVTTEALHH
jgi:DNA-binding MarR family transcriptional regulator